jgi:hypothetical protein
MIAGLMSRAAALAVLFAIGAVVTPARAGGFGYVFA